METVVLVSAIVLILVSFIIWACSRYKKCPSDKDNFCIIDGKAYKLEDVEKMGIDEFSKSAHIFPYKSLFKYYPNVRKYEKEEKNRFFGEKR